MWNEKLGKWEIWGRPTIYCKRLYISSALGIAENTDNVCYKFSILPFACVPACRECFMLFVLDSMLGYHCFLYIELSQSQ